MFGKKKELTPEQNREQMEAAGIKVNPGYKREKKFGQFADHAKEIASKKDEQYIPGQGRGVFGGGGGSGSGSSSSNPYANAQLNYQPSINSQHSQPPPSYHSNPPSTYNGYEPSPPAARPPPSQNNPYASAQQSYQTRFGSQQPSLQRTETSDTYDRNRNALFKGAREEDNKGGLPGRSGMASINNKYNSNNEDEDELNQMPSEIDRNGGGYAEEEKEEAMDSEDEDAEAIKGQIRFTKQQSVNSSRNALRIAAEAEESGRNALGMLGSQGERLANTEHNLSLAETQNKIAEEKAKELKQANRSMFAVHVSNPFGAKRRLQEKEERMKADKRMEQANREGRRQTAYDSQQRVQSGLTQKSELAQKYKPRNMTERSKYQFEADSEDEAMEDEIDNNLNGISQATGRLKKLAMSTNEEVTRQNQRLDNIAESTDTLDVNVHLNTSRLANIK